MICQGVSSRRLAGLLLSTNPSMKPWGTYCREERQESDDKRIIRLQIDTPTHLKSS